MKPSNLLVMYYISAVLAFVINMANCMCTADNGLSFIETSALDASNVELSFQRILTGIIFCLVSLACSIVQT